MNEQIGRHSELSNSTVRTAAEIRDWLVSRISTEVQTSPQSIACDQPLLSTGIDSLQVVSILAQLEDWLGFRFEGNPLEDHLTINDLADHVASMFATKPLDETSPSDAGN